MPLESVPAPFGFGALLGRAPRLLQALGGATLLAATAAIAPAAGPKPEAAPELRIPHLAVAPGTRLEMTVLTEATPAGRSRPVASPQQPLYYVSHSGGYHSFGSVPRMHPLDTAMVQSALQRALAAAGYQPATGAHPPSVFINFIWGAHFHNDADDPVPTLGDAGALVPVAAYDNLLDRAALIGGTRFANRLARAINERNTEHWSLYNGPGFPQTIDGMSFDMASAMRTMDAEMDPVHLMANGSAKTDFLVHQTAANCYYVVVSAYDYASVSTQRKLLLWRSSMTVDAEGVAQDAILSAIAAAAPHFGRDMAEADVIIRRAAEPGRVEVGEPTVVATSEPTP